MHLDTVFKAYDIRGRTDRGEIHPNLYRAIGSALVGLLRADRVAVGRDCRRSSEGLFEGLAGGITRAGADVIDLGEVPTDVVYYYSGTHDVPGAVITASHNPPEYNGLKLCRAGAAPVGVDTGLAEIKEAVAAGGPFTALVPGALKADNPIPGYIDHLFGIVAPGSIGGLRVAVDGGNGMVGVCIEQVFSRIEAKLEGLYLEPDGTFPNHPADPIQPENLVELIRLISGGGHDLGVAFDGDADRAFFIDEAGQPLSGSTVTALIARWMLQREPGAPVVHNLITSRAVPEVVAEFGGEPIRTRVGHSFIKQVMAETGAVFGGEHSGHYYFRDNYRADSGMLAMLVLMRVVTEAGRPLSEIRSEVERYAGSGEINLSVGDPAAALTAVEKAFSDSVLDRLDGLSVDLGWAWFNLRPSNTEPLLRLNVEAPDREAVDSAVEKVKSTIGVTT
jgi:phosphomannomutase